MKRILIPTDFSAHSQHATKYVLELFQETQIPCHLILVNTFMVQQSDPDRIIAINDEMKKISKVGLEQERVMAMKKITNSQITIDVASHMGSLGNVILNLIQKENIDLVAMGKNGGRHVEQVATLLKKQHCPLLLTYLR